MLDITSFLKEMTELQACKRSSAIPQIVGRMLVLLFPQCSHCHKTIHKRPPFHTERPVFVQMFNKQQLQDELLSEVFTKNPFSEYIAGGGTNPVMRMSDFISVATWKKDDLFGSYVRMTGNEFVVGFRVETYEHMHAFTLGRSGADFVSEELQLLDEFQKVIRQSLCLDKKEVLNGDPGEVVRKDLTHFLARSLKLTPRQAEIGFWVAEGKTNKEIASLLSISPLTVRTHLSQIFQQLEIGSRSKLSQLVAIALNSGN